MLSSLLSPTSSEPPQGRISQLLPSVKCSTCHRPVPLAELGDHTCEAPPPVPSLPKPAITPEAATSLLPGRLQGRVNSPSTPTPPRAQDHQRGPSAGSSRLQINTRTTGGTSPTQSNFPAKSSPLARSDDNNSPHIREPPFSNASQSPLRARLRTASNTGSVSSLSSPSTARPMGSFSGPSSREAPTPPGPPSRNGPPFPAQGPQPPRGPPVSSMNNLDPPVNRGPPPAGHNNGMPPPMAARPPASSSGPGSRELPPPMSAPPRNASPFAQPPRMGPPPTTNGFPPYPNNRPPPPGSAGSSVSFPPRPGPPPLSAGNVPPNGFPRNMGGPPPGSFPSRSEAFVPPAERGIDTKTGGEAGMAGVGRRGFAAAARAAMFVGPNGRPGGPQPQTQYGRRPNAPQFLDTNAVSRSTSTPPLSDGSGYSSPSPSPLSPIPQIDPRYPPQLLPSHNTPTAQLSQSRTPSPSNPPMATPTQALTRKPSDAPTLDTKVAPEPPAASSPISARLPFFEKLRGRLPGLGSAEPDLAKPVEILPSKPESPAPLTARPLPSQNIPIRTASSSTRSNSRTRHEERRPPSPIDSDSEYGGLAYADSTDDDDVGDGLNTRQARSRSPRRSGSPPPSMSVAASILQRGSSKTRHIQFGSVSARSRSQSSDRGSARVEGARPMGGRATHSRENSLLSQSSYSSTGSDVRGRPRTNSSAVAQALGLSQTPPSDYKRLGGPGIVGRSHSRGSPAGRSRPAEEEHADSGNGLDRSESSSKSSVSFSSAAKQRVYGTSIDSGRGVPASVSSSSSVRKLPSVDVDAANDYYKEDAGDSVLGGAGGSKAQRSRTVQGTQSPEAAKKPIKLPMRSLTSPSPKAVDKALVDAGSSTKKKKTKTCVRCTKVISDGRWVSVDGGGVLCEKCWKNMYLPKCRRCNLPIERAAVSSSDGQLKGKYHKECFNCHTCHKPFPDKTFYVYDGKPLCAYHYHEANDSLCAAALCGQPIEGPCAVSHSGDRYHPEHMTCEYPGYPECHERLNEYWEVDGRMLCERHAYATRNGSDEDDEEEWVQSSRAKKRVTRFIDLAGATVPSSGGTGAGDIPRI